MSRGSVYLFACDDEERAESPGSVFYRVEDESTAAVLQRLCTKEFTGLDGLPSFSYKPDTSIPLEDLLLMDEALQWLDVYSEPDAAVYEQQPAGGTRFRADYAKRARGWDTLLGRRKPSAEIQRSVASIDKATDSRVDALPHNGINLFYSYCHKDERYRTKVESHLSTLKREGLISEWHDRKITGGNEWKGKIDEHLQEAKIILLLVSADFINSDYCYDIEVKKAVERHDSGLARVIPVILRPCDWQSTALGKLQALPKNGKPLTTWSPQDSGYLDIATGLRKVINELGNRPPALSPTSMASDSSVGTARAEPPAFEERVKVALSAGGSASALPPYSTGEPIHLAIQLTITNIGTFPVFVVSAKLCDVKGRHNLDFGKVCSETDPLQAGARRKTTLPLLYHTPFPRAPQNPRRQLDLKNDNLFVFRLLRFIRQADSVFQIETGRGTLFKFPAVDVCDTGFLGWPYIATPDDVLAELGSKSLEDFDADERAAWQRAGRK